MTQEEFDALNLQKGDYVVVQFYEKRKKPRLLNTGTVAYNGSNGDTNYFNTEEWDSSFYMIWTRKIKEIKIVKRK